MYVFFLILIFISLSFLFFYHFFKNRFTFFLCEFLGGICCLSFLFYHFFKKSYFININIFLSVFLYFLSLIIFIKNFLRLGSSCNLFQRKNNIIFSLKSFVTFILSCFYMPNSWYVLKCIDIKNSWWFYELIIPIINFLIIIILFFIICFFASFNVIDYVINLFKSIILRIKDKFIKKDDEVIDDINHENKEDNIGFTLEEYNQLVYGDKLISDKKTDKKEKIEKIEKSQTNSLKASKEKFLEELNHPKQLKTFLDKYIIGQENAKKIVSQVVFNHIKITRDKLDLPEQNLLLIGPSGCGKTEMFRVLKKELGLKVHIIDISSISFAGYSSAGGNHLSDILKDIKSGEIIVFDEFDKILLKNNGLRRDGDMLQSEFLKLLEGEKFELNNCLFVFAGAFCSKNFEINLNPTFSTPIGFLEKNENIDTFKESFSKEFQLKEKLKEFGIMNELLGRLSFIVELKGLSNDEFLAILKNKNGLYFEYKKQFKEQYNANIILEDELLNYFIDEAIEENLGVRAINSKIMNCFNEILYSLKDDFKYTEIVLNKDNFNDLQI